MPIQQESIIGELKPEDWIIRHTRYFDFPGTTQSERQALMVERYIEQLPAYCFSKSISYGLKTSQGILLSNYFPITPGARQFDHLPSWSTSCILGPMAEELAFTYIPSKLFGDYAQIIIPGLFGACHVKHLQDKNFAIHVFTHTVLTSFINHRVVRRDPESELPVTIMRHMLNNQIMYLYQTSRN